MKQSEPQQKHRLGMISKIKLLEGLTRFYRALTSPLAATAVVHNI